MSYSKSLLRLNNIKQCSRLKPIPPARLFRRAIIGSSLTFQHSCNRLLFFDGLRQMSRRVPFLVPITLSPVLLARLCIYTLRFCSEPVNLNTPITCYGFSEGRFLLNRIDRTFMRLYISAQSDYRPVHSQIRQSILLDILTIGIL